MKTYDFFVDYYDEIIRWNWYSLNDEVSLIDELITKFSFWWIDILELAVWTWVIANELEKLWYNVVWLDISEKMLEKAKQNIKKENLILWDMRNFDLNKKFDVILCNNNSINHLLKKEDWEKMFIQSYKHLKKWWLLIFDILTIFEFENITRDFRWFFDVWKDTICLEMFKKESPFSDSWKNFIYEWLIKMFIFQEDKYEKDKYKLIKEVVRENSFEIEEIKEMLKKYDFEVLHLEDYHKEIVDEESERVYFVAKRL